MTISMYQASVPVFLRQLRALSTILDKGEAFVAENGIDQEAVLGTRLAPDMFTLTRQVQIATDAAKGGIARLAGVEIPAFADDETSFADLKARVARTIAFIDGIEPVAVDGSEERAIVIKMRDRQVDMAGQAYLLHFALPNFFFHVTTTYAILRAQGVSLGKADFLGSN